VIEHAHSYTQVTEQERRVHVNDLGSFSFLMPIAPSSPTLPPSWGPALSGRKDEPKQAHLNESQSERQIRRSEVPQMSIMR
jgi:hypothetical protein